MDGNLTIYVHGLKRIEEVSKFSVSGLSGEEIDTMAAAGFKLL